LLFAKAHEKFDNNNNVRNTTSRGGGGGGGSSRQLQMSRVGPQGEVYEHNKLSKHPPPHPRLITDIADYQMEN